MNRKTREEFITTNEYLQFTEFCNSCRHCRYIGLYYGIPGVGKTFSARNYSQWDKVEKLLDKPLLSSPIRGLNKEKDITLFYTCPVTATPSRIEREIEEQRMALAILLQASMKAQRRHVTIDDMLRRQSLIMIDEADRLKASALEQIRDIYDRLGKGIILIGMPGIEKRLSRYSQLYSRVGFIHQAKALKNDEIYKIIEDKWQDFWPQENGGSQKKETISAIIRITRGNFRLLNRLMMQIDRIMEVNHFDFINKEAVETAREFLIIGL